MQMGNSRPREVGLLFSSGVGAKTELLWGEFPAHGLELFWGKAFLIFGDVMPLGDHFFEAAGLFLSEIVEFGTVLGEVVEFPAAHFG